MTSIARALWKHWNENRAADVQIALRGVPPLSGPMVCLNETEVATGAAPLFEIAVKAQMGPGGELILPIVFASEDVAWYSGGPRPLGKPSIITASRS